MRCRDVRELADSFLSEQLLVETNHELLRHLDTCPDCRADMADRRALRDGLRTAFSRADDLRPRPEFAAELLATLRPSLPERPSAPAKEISRRSVLQSWWALAAGVVLAAGGGLVVRNSTNRSRLGSLYIFRSMERRTTHGVNQIRVSTSAASRRTSADR